MMDTRRFLCALLILALVPQTACRESSKAPASGTLMVREGSATIVIAGQSQVVAAQKTAAVPLGAVVKTAPGGRGVVKWGDQLHSLEPDTELRFDAPASDGSEKGVSKVELVRGLVTFFLPKGEASKPYKFQAGCGTIVAAVKGTIFRVDARARDLGVQVLAGAVSLFRRDGPGAEPAGDPVLEVTPDKRAIVPDGGAGAPVAVPVNPKDVDADLFMLKALVEENNLVIGHF
jgi:ferric-dicitrate binding protein FerR (iron transport regulator)